MLTINGPRRGRLRWHLLSMLGIAFLTSAARAVDIPVLTNSDTGIGSLRAAFVIAESGDRIVFRIPGAPTTIELQSDLPTVDVDVSFANESAGDVTIDRMGNGPLSFEGSLVDPTVLVVNTSIVVPPPSTDISAGANTTVYGDGNVLGNLRVQGAIAPGGDSNPGTVGTFNVVGDLDMSGANAELDLSAVGSTLSSDLINVVGDVDVDGATLVPNFVGEDFEAGQSFTVLSASGSLSGSFVNQGNVFDLPNNPFLEAIEDVGLGANEFGFFIQDNGNPFTSAAMGCNQLSAASLLDDLAAGAPPPSWLDDLRNGSTSDVILAYNQVSGSIYPSLISAEINHIQANLESVRNRADLLFCAQPGEWSLAPWIRGYGVSAEANEDDCGTLGYRHEIGGMEVGCGLNCGGSFTAYTFAHLASGTLRSHGVDQRADTDSYRLGGLLGYVGDHLYLVAAGGAGVQEYGVRRSLSAFGGSDFAESSFDGSAEFGYVEVGTNYFGPWTPYVGMHGSRVELDPIVESGDATFALTNAGGSGDSLRGILGVSLKACGPPRIWDTTTRVRFGWTHEYGDPAQVFVSQIANGGDPAPPLVDRGIDSGRDWGFLRMQVDMGVMLGGQFTVAYEGQFNSRSSYNSFLGGLRWIY